MRRPESKTSIAGHPIHPMLVPFPIAFFTGALLCDLAFWNNANLVWVTAAEWMLGAGLVMAALAAIAGITDFLGERLIRNIDVAWWHAGLNIVMVLIEAYNLYVRYTMGPAAVLYGGLVMSAVSVGIMLVTGWLGGELVYRHGVGVVDNPADRIGDRIYNRRTEEVKDDDQYYPPGSRPPPPRKEIRPSP